MCNRREAAARFEELLPDWFGVSSNWLLIGDSAIRGVKVDELASVERGVTARMSGVLLTTRAFRGTGVLQPLSGAFVFSLILVNASSQDLAIGICVSTRWARPLIKWSLSAFASSLWLVLQTRWRTSSAHVTIWNKILILKLKRNFYTISSFNTLMSSLADQATHVTSAPWPSSLRIGLDPPFTFHM